MANKFSKKKPGAQTRAKKGNGKTKAAEPRGSNVIINPDEAQSFLDRVLQIKNEVREAQKGAAEDIGNIVGEAATALNVSKGAFRQFATDYIASVRREERARRREETNPDMALDYERLAAAFGEDTPMGAYAKAQAGADAEDAGA